MRYHTVQLNIVCTPEEKSRLLAMAARARCSQAEVVRRSLSREFERMVDVAVAEQKAGKLAFEEQTILRRLLDFCAVR